MENSEDQLVNNKITIHPKIYPFMVDLIKITYGNDISDSQLVEYLNLEFDCNITLNDLILYLSPTVEQDIEDLETQFRNLGYA